MGQDLAGRHPHGLVGQGGYFNCAWMSYVSPRFAALIVPPAGVVAERRPNGGLVMAATTDTFRTADPQHLAAARAIEAALAPMNRLPYPIDDPTDDDDEPRLRSGSALETGAWS